ncbi:MAG: hypothetical protein ABEJ81_02890 [Haloferacaceae archaeon]
MSDPRTLLAAVLGIGLGALSVASPGTVVRIHAAGRIPSDRGGEYGTTSVPDRARWIVRLLGVACLALGGYFGALALGVVG